MGTSGHYCLQARDVSLDEELRPSQAARQAGSAVRRICRRARGEGLDEVVHPQPRHGRAEVAGVPRPHQRNIADQ